MKSIEAIRESETRLKKLLEKALKSDKRISLSCPEFAYPEPVYFYVKSIKTEKSIAISIDGVTDTLRFWDYFDDSYENEDGVWEKISGDNIDKFVAKLKRVMDCAVDIEFFDDKGITDDYYAGVIGVPLDENAARALLKKHGASVKFIFAKISNFYGDKQFVLDRHLNTIRG